MVKEQSNQINIRFEVISTTSKETETCITIERIIDYPK